MISVAKRGSMAAVNGPGRAALAQAVTRHRDRRALSREALAELTGWEPGTGKGVSPGTIKNVETKDQDVTGKTLDALDRALEWEPGTARAILVDNAAAPLLPSTQQANGPVLNRRLMVEYEGREVLDVRAVDVSGRDARIVITLVGSGDMDTQAIREALLELDEFERLARRLRDDDR